MSQQTKPQDQYQLARRFWKFYRRTDLPASLESLLARCESELERDILQEITRCGLSLPDEAQKIIYDRDTPVTRADFFYRPNHVVFVDGPPHKQDYVQAMDANTRRHLRRLNYRPLVIRYDDREAGLTELTQRLV